MKFNDKHIPIEDIKAETVVSVMSDDTCPEVRVHGSFYRNYFEDIIRITGKEGAQSIVVELSRDGVYHLMPENLFFQEDRLLIKKRKFLSKNGISNETAIKEEVKKLRSEKKQLLAFFRFFDTHYFAAGVNLEKEIFEIENIYTELILKHFFEYDIKNEENIYIKKIAPLLIYACEIRGNFLLLQKILSAVLKFRVEIKNRNFFKDQCVELIPYIEFIIHIKGLSKKEYQELNMVYAPFFRFISEWFLPFETEFGFKIKDIAQPFILNEKQLILDYNTQFINYESEQ